jgi:uncharacterized protein (TIGR00730 family)
MKRLCVFCGSSPGADPAFASAARQLGALLAERRIGLVYGGASVGLMAEIANSTMAAAGEVIGVIPHSLVDREVAHRGLRDLRVVDSMHQRKAAMADLSDGFIAMPGGLGTLEEFFEVLTWAQLGMHTKPCGLLNIRGFYDKLLAFLDHAVEQRFIKPVHRATVMVADRPDDLLAKLEAYRAPASRKWIDRAGS